MTSDGPVPVELVFQPTPDLLTPDGLAKDWPLVIRVEDVHGAHSFQDLPCTSCRLSRTGAPQFVEPLPFTEAFVGKEYQFQLSAFDPDDDELTFELTDLALGIDESDFRVSESGFITWTPRDEHVDQTFSTSVSVRDYELGSTLPFDVQVLQANADPYFTSKPSDDYLDAPITFEVPALVPSDPLAIDRVSPGALNFTLGEGQSFETVVSVNAGQAAARTADIVLVLDVTRNSNPAIIDDLMWDRLVATGTDSLLFSLEEELRGEGFLGNRYGITVFEGFEDSPADAICFPGLNDLAICDETDTTRMPFLSTSDTEPNFGMDAVSGAIANTNTLSVGIDGAGEDPYLGILEAIGTDYTYDDDDNPHGFRAAAQKYVLLVTSNDRECLSTMDGCDVFPSDEPNRSDANVVVDELNDIGAQLFTVVAAPHDVEWYSNSLSFQEATLFVDVEGTWRPPSTVGDTFFDDDSPTHRPTIEAVLTQESPLAVALFQPHNTKTEDYSFSFEVQEDVGKYFAFDFTPDGDFKFFGLEQRENVGDYLDHKLVSGSVVSGDIQYEEFRGYDDDAPEYLSGSGFQLRPGDVLQLDVDARPDHVNLNITHVGLDEVVSNRLEDFDWCLSDVVCDSDSIGLGFFEELYFSNVGLAAQATNSSVNATFESFLQGPYGVNALAESSDNSGSALLAPDPRRFGIWDEFSGPRAIGVGARGVEQLSFVPDGDGNFYTYNLAIQNQASPFVGFDDYTVNDQVQAAMTVGSDYEIQYEDVNNDLVNIARATRGATFDYELLINDIPSSSTDDSLVIHNGYISSFAKAFAFLPLTIPGGLSMPIHLIRHLLSMARFLCSCRRKPEVTKSSS